MHEFDGLLALNRLEQAVEKVRGRLLRSTAALEALGIGAFEETQAGLALRFGLGFSPAYDFVDCASKVAPRFLLNRPVARNQGFTGRSRTPLDHYPTKTWG